jgi:ectoine hydroxylase-related dioxygenase (phytanoyl-CoA dioxygenase family)
MTVDTEIVASEQCEKFERDGYLRFDPEIPGEVLDGCLADLDARYLRNEGRPQLIDGVLYSPGLPRIRDAWRISENVKAIALAPRVLAVLEALYRKKPLCFQTLNFEVPTEQSPHSDSMHFMATPPEFMCGVWVALEDIDTDNGPLIYYPRSHKLPFLDYPDIRFEAKEEDFSDNRKFADQRNRQYEAHIGKLIEENGFEPEYGTIKKGQALVWAANLLHGGAPLNDRTRTRNSQVSHYLFKGTDSYYTPLVSSDTRKVRVEPTFIS